MASNIAYVDLDGVAQRKQNSKTVRYIVGAVAFGLVLGYVGVDILKSNFVAPEMALGASGPVELSAGASSFMNTIQAPRLRSPFPSIIVQGGAYQPPNAPAFAENYLGKLRDARNAPLTYGGGFSPAPASYSPATSGDFSPEQLAFMQRTGKLPSGVASPAPASSSTAASGGFTPEQLAFMERQNALRGGASPAPASFSSSYGSSSSSPSKGFAPTKGKGYGKSYMR